MEKIENLIDALRTEFWTSGTNALSEAVSTAVFMSQTNGLDVTTAIPDIELDRTLCENIHALCNLSEPLIFNFYATAICLLLSRYSLRNEIYFISPVRQFSGEDHNFFLYKCSIDEKLSFKEIFSANKEFLIRSLNNRHSFETIEQNIGPEKLSKLYEFGLVVGQKREYTGHLPPVLFKIEKKHENFYFTIKTEGSSWNRNMLGLFGLNFSKLLKEIVSELYQPVGDLDIHSNAECDLLKELNSVTPYFPTDKDVTALIRRQAELHPGKMAIQLNGTAINYASLESRTNQLARYLISVFQLKPDRLVGVMMTRSISMAECIIAIWKAGGAYVPIDIDFPGERIRQIVDDSQLCGLLIDRSTESYLQRGIAIPVPVVNIDEMETLISELPGTPTDIQIQLDSLAYVIYTSGSTGKPKGVMIEHRGMVNHIGSKIVEMGITAESKVAQNATHTFDISVWQFFSGLAAGGSTVIFDQDTVADPIEFISRIEAEKVTTLELVPSYLTEMLAVLEDKKIPVSFSCLKILILNAETLMPSMVKRWLDLYPHVPIVNTYGATEASDDISHYIMHSCPNAVKVPVAKKPIQNFEVHIVNEKMQLMPFGVPGEILLAGPAVGRGYLNDVSKTEKSFLSGPLPGITTHKRIYRTGDFGRYLADGTLEFLGRKDKQVKIRGNRVELGEIEHALVEIPEIENSLVLPNMEGQYLVAYYQAEQILSDEYILRMIRDQLPDYMLPHHYIHLNKFPVTPNGKIDKNALPDPRSLAIRTNAEYIAPGNPVEQQLALIWEEILGQARIGIKDNFFDLGGHSLKAMKLLARIHKEFNVRIRLEDIFNGPTIGDIAKNVSRMIWLRQGKEEYSADLTLDKSFIL